MTRDRRGFALVTTLWLLVVLAGLLAAFTQVARQGRRSVISLAEVERARWAARAAAAILLDRVDRDPAGRTLGLGATGAGGADSANLEFALNDVPVRLTVVDTRARLDLNLAQAPELFQLLVALDVPEARAATLVDAILDWRDPDLERRPAGAETAEYQARRPPGRPRNGPFLSVDQVGEVLGVDPDLASRLEPFLTISGDGIINVNSAPVPVLATLPGLDLSDARRLADRRRTAPFRNVFEVIATLGSGTQAAIGRQLEEFSSRIAFTARSMEITVVADPGRPSPAARLRLAIELGTNSSARVLRQGESPP